MELLRTFTDCPYKEPPQEPADEEHFAQVLRSLSMLKRRSDDDLTAKLRDKLYWAKLRHLPRAAIAFMCDKGLERWDWFPTIKECLELASEWTPPRDPELDARVMALVMLGCENRLRWADLRLAVLSGAMDADAIAQLPERAQLRLDDENLIRRHGNGAIRIVDHDEAERAFLIGRIERMMQP